MKKKRGHNPKMATKRVARVYCVRCGLMKLRNKVSEQAWNKGCDADND